MRRATQSATLLAALGAWGAAQAAEPSAAIAALKADSARYTKCMNQVETSPKDAFAAADDWAVLGGGEPAKHCAAAALLKLGFPAEAAERLEALAKATARDDDVHAHILDQAGQAWAEAKEWDKAHADQSAALKLAPNAADLWISRARTQARAQNWGLAIDDLTEALKRDPKSTEALTLRASAYRYMDALDLARDDLDAVLKVEPANPETRLESGIVHRLQRKPDRARRDWREALLAVPEDAPIVEDIRRNIELLELGEPPIPAKP